MNSSSGIPQTRSTPIDIARGIAIIGVVFNHTVDGLIGAGILAEESPIGQLNMAMYIFRIPALFFLVGLFIPFGVERRGASRYLLSRVAVLLWLFVIWQCIQGLVEAATSGLRNGESSVVEILYFWAPIAHLWFLPTLAVATTIVVLSRCWEPTWSGLLMLFLLLAFGVLAWGWSLNWVGLRGLSLVAFLALGAGLGLQRMSAVLDRRPLVWAAVAVAGLVGTLSLSPMGTEPATYAGEAGVRGQALSFVAALLGVTAILALSVVVSRIPLLSKGLTAVGRRTLGIYLVHIMVVAGGRVVLMRLEVESVWVLLAVLIPAGVLVPIALESLAKRCRAGWLFALPRRLDEAIISATSPGARHRAVIGPLHNIDTLPIQRLGFRRLSGRRTGVTE